MKKRHSWNMNRCKDCGVTREHIHEAPNFTWGSYRGRYSYQVFNKDGVRIQITKTLPACKKNPRLIRSPGA